MLEQKRLEYGLYSQQQILDLLNINRSAICKKAHNQGMADGALEQRAQSPLPILSQQAVGEVMDMVSNGKPLPPHIADAVRAYGGLRPFIESELIKNNVKVDDARKAARERPAEFYEVELEEDAPAVQEVSMIDRLVGGSIALIGAMLPGAPAQATSCLLRQLTSHRRPMGQARANEAIIRCCKASRHPARRFGCGYVIRNDW